METTVTLESLQSQIDDLRKKSDRLEAILEHVTEPPNLYIKNLARETAAGNFDALKEHNRRRKKELGIIDGRSRGKKRKGAHFEKPSKT